MVMITVLFYLALFICSSCALGRDLQEEMWDVTIHTFEDQHISYSTGPGVGENSIVKVTLWDKCRSESPDRIELGELYPASTVPGLQLDTSGVVHELGQGVNTVAFTFVKGVESNTDIYTDHGDNTATISFCAQVGLYSDNDLLLNWKQVRLTYHVSLTASFSSLSGPTQSGAASFSENKQDLTAPPLEAYFCDPETQSELHDSHLSQGSLVSICFTVPGDSQSQFQVSDITDLVVEDLSGTSEQLVVSDGSVFSAEKSCTNNVCVLTLPLEAQFFDFTALTLTGMGSGVLKLGGDSLDERRKHSLLRRHLNNNDEEEEKHEDDVVDASFMVKPTTFRVVAAVEDSDGSNNNNSHSSAGTSLEMNICVVTVAAISAASMLLWC